MAVSLSINAMQIDFALVLAMEYTGMVRMFNSLEKTGLKGFLEVSGLVFEGPVIEFFANAKVIAGTVVSVVANRKMVITKDVFAEAFGLPIEGMVSFIYLPVQTVAEMRMRFSDFVPNIGSDGHTPTKQSQGFAVQLRVFLAKLVQADLGESMKLHPLKSSVLTNKAEKEAGETMKPETTAGEKKKKSKEKVVPVVKKQVVVLKKPVEARSQASPVKSKFGTSSDADSCPLAKLVAAKKGQAAPKQKQVVESLDSESIVSIPPMLITKSNRQREPRRDQRDQLETHLLSKIDPVAKGKEILEAFSLPNDLVEEHCLLVLRSAWEDVSSKMSEYDNWVHFRTAVRLNNVMTIIPIESLAKIEDQFLFWAETERVSELFERRMLVLSKLYEMEVHKRVDEHCANFNTAEPSVNYDYMCIRFLIHEFKEIVKQHRALRSLAGLSFLVPEASIAGDAANVDLPQITWTEAHNLLLTEATPAQQKKPKILVIEFSTQAEQAQTAEKQLAQPEWRVEEIVRTVEGVEETSAVNPQEHQAQGNEQQTQGEEIQAQSDEQQAHNAPDQEAEEEAPTVHPIQSK
ncbi:hypothetical protein F511_21116 [Dorcoceras hygrometricum]|uniref:Uncharacterized protein n=1 Tax=Dorcoceras hygrometricum TaxID=472368 RepID=A0A2Z7C962_9LAMI|nr:hypothetical protein F511_21116 [Dorcoceras hygrometricum]